MVHNGTAASLIEQQWKDSGQLGKPPEGIVPPHRRITSNKPHAIANRASYARTKSLKKATQWCKELMEQNPDFEASLNEIVGSPAGSKLLPKLAKNHREAKAGLVDKRNLKQYMDNLPQHSANRQHATVYFGEGKSITETAEDLGVSKRMARKSKATKSKVQAVQSNFVNAKYEFGTTRTGIVKMLAQETVDHFSTGLSFVSSGSANDSRSLPMTKQDAYRAFREAFPGILLRVLAKYPELRANAKKRSAEVP